MSKYRFVVEIEVELKNGDLVTHVVSSNARTVSDAEREAMAATEKRYPNAQSDRIVCVTDYTALSKFFPA